MVLRQIDVARHHQIIYLYQAVGFETIQLLLRSPLELFMRSQQSMVTLYKEEHYKYEFSTVYRKYINFAILECVSAARDSTLSVYDGIGTDILLKVITRCESVPMFGIKTEYFKSVIELNPEKGQSRQYFKVRFEVLFTYVIDLEIPSQTIVIQHKYAENMILKKIYRIAAPEGATFYPRIKMNIKELFGYTDSTCSYGGMLLLMSGDHLGNVPHKNGALICDMDAGGFLVGKLNTLTLSYGETFLIIFAYSNKFNIDAKLLITKDECEGFVNMCSFCLELIKRRIQSNKLKTREATLFCNNVRSGFARRIEYYVSVHLHANSCIKLQSMVLYDLLICRYVAIYPYTNGHLSVGISFVAAKPLLKVGKNKCGTPYLESIVTHMRNQHGNKIFLNKDEDIVFATNYVAVSHYRECKHIQFSYSLSLQTSSTTVVCPVDESLNPKMYSICGNFITNYQLPVLNRIYIK